MTARRDTNRTPSPRLGGGGRGQQGTRIAPLPALLDGRQWDIRIDPTGGSVQLTGNGSGGMMIVPGTESLRDRRIRLHEMGHVRWTPLTNRSDADGVDQMTLNACEDRRIHRRLHEQPDWKRLLVDVPILTEEQRLRMAENHIVRGAPKRWDPLEAARMVVASDLTEESAWLRDQLAAAGYGWVAPLCDEITESTGLAGRRPAFRTAVDAARALEALFAPGDDPDPDAPEGTIRSDTELLERLMDDSERSRYYGEGGPKDRHGWGEMRETVAPMPLRLPRGLTSRRNRATDSGAVPRNWHRAPIDGAVFSRKMKRPDGGGTVLIDVSGSMHLDPDEIAALVEAFPAVTVATYCGNEWMGELRIVARDGRRAEADDMEAAYGGNTVDGPALQWLARQAEPRIWVSDGLVVGRRGNGWNGSHPRLLLECGQICKRGRIARRDRLGSLLPAENDPTRNPDAFREGAS